jgi:hypothetical protein
MFRKVSAQEGPAPAPTGRFTLAGRRNPLPEYRQNNVQALARAFLVLAVTGGRCAAARPRRRAGRRGVIVLANSDDADSLRLARYYAEKTRGAGGQHLRLQDVGGRDDRLAGVCRDDLAAVAGRSGARRLDRRHSDGPGRSGGPAQIRDPRPPDRVPGRVPRRAVAHRSQSRVGDRTGGRAARQPAEF